MNAEQALILTILVATMGLFLWGRWRHDMVAVGALLACVVAGLVAPADAFSGFGHPAVVTVACVLVLSRGLQNSGAVDVLTRYALPSGAGRTTSLAALVGLGALLSGFMNNVGALALLMPVAIQLAGRLELPPGRVLMPLAFGTILGGMTTLIGTPPNLIVSGFRAESGMGPFAMFDFMPVGLTVAVLGVIFVTVVGWRLVPRRERPDGEGFETGAYLTEAHVPATSKAAGMRLREIEEALDESGAQVVGLVRNDVRMNAPAAGRVIRAGDILVLEADVEALPSALSALGLELEEAGSSSERDAEDESGEDRGDEGRDQEGKGEPSAGTRLRSRPHATAMDGVQSRRMRRDGDASTSRDGATGDAAGSDGEKADRVVEREEREREREGKGERAARSGSSIGDRVDDVVLAEFVVRPESSLAGRSASDIQLRSRYGVNLLAVSREGSRSRARLRTLHMRAGDLLLMQGSPETLAEFAADFGCVPLAERDLRIPDRRRAWTASLIMLLSVAVAAFGLLPTPVAFAAGVLASMVLRTVPPRSVYNVIDWSIIVLLAALIPLASALEATGAAGLIARTLLEHVAQGHAVVALGLILLVTMFVSDVMNNAATAAVMCPIALGTAAALGVSADPFLMAVAIGASCAFLTPIGHQNNTLILGPGGFRFGDYWRLGLLVEILVATISIPALVLVWPM